MNFLQYFAIATLSITIVFIPLVGVVMLLFGRRSPAHFLLATVPAALLSLILYPFSQHGLFDAKQFVALFLICLFCNMLFCWSMYQFRFVDVNKRVLVKRRRAIKRVLTYFCKTNELTNGNQHTD